MVGVIIEILFVGPTDWVDNVVGGVSFSLLSGGGGGGGRGYLRLRFTVVVSAFRFVIVGWGFVGFAVLGVVAHEFL
jgi:hypothetical protein